VMRREAGQRKTFAKRHADPEVFHVER
jgi:hypothetical protein